MKRSLGVLGHVWWMPTAAVRPRIRSAELAMPDVAYNASLTCGGRCPMAACLPQLGPMEMGHVITSISPARPEWYNLATCLYLLCGSYV